MAKKTVTLAKGDGIGPEITAAVVRILEEAGAEVDFEEIEVGEKIYKSGHGSGIAPESWETIRRNRILLKGPITTPQGGGYKSLNVTIRKTLGLYANVRPCVSYHPFIRTKHPQMDVVIIRENEEDLYAGIEHRQTSQVYQCLKLITRPGCERIVRFAFEYARLNNRRAVSCFVKDNIMKLTDGLFHQVFNKMDQEYPDIPGSHWIVDIGAARLADTPEMFDVIVMPNLYGDILSDVAAQITGSVGLGGSANIGDQCAMFEAIHGSAPTIAGQNVANPSGMLLGAVMMLVHIGLPETATRVHNAWLRTIEDGIHTADIYREGTSKEHVGTQGFADAVIQRLGKNPETLPPVDYVHPPEAILTEQSSYEVPAPEKKELIGVDVFLDWTAGTPDELGAGLKLVEGDEFRIALITNRGVKVWPGGYPETFCTDHWRCRFRSKKSSGTVTHQDVIGLLQRLADAGYDFIKTEHLCTFDGQPGFSMGQGE